MAFIDDIQSRDTVLFPIVTFILFKNTDNETRHRISTKSFSLDGEHYSPLLISSPSIKESIDLYGRKYKISNVSLKVSNVDYDGARFTDSTIPINTEVLIHWVGPSCTALSDCYLAYQGIIRNIKHDEKICNISLEDASETKLHRDVPVAVLGVDDNTPDKYKNKPIPMVYGNVDKSPVVISSFTPSEQTMGEFYIFVDRTEPISGNPALDILEVKNKSIGFDFNTTNFANNNPSYLMVSDNGLNGYLLAEVFIDGNEWGEHTRKQFSINENNTIVGYRYSTGSDVAFGVDYSPLAANTLQVISLNEILPYDYEVNSIHPLTSYTVHDELIHYDMATILYPYYDGGEAYQFFTDYGVDFDFQPTPSIFYTGHDNPGEYLTFGILSNDPASLMMQRTSINFPAPAFSDNERFQSATYRIRDLKLNIPPESMSYNTFNGYAFFAVWDEVMGTPEYVVSFPPDFDEGLYEHPTDAYYTSDVDHYGGSNVLSVDILPPYSGSMKVESLEYQIRLERVYHLNDGDFWKEGIYADVSGRIN